MRLGIAPRAACAPKKLVQPIANRKSRRQPGHMRHGAKRKRPEPLQQSIEAPALAAPGVRGARRGAGRDTLTTRTGRRPPVTGKARRTPRRAFQWETGPLTATDLSIRHGPYRHCCPKLVTSAF